MMCVEGMRNSTRARVAACCLLAATTFLVIMLMAGPVASLTTASMTTAGTTRLQLVASGGGEVVPPDGDYLSPAQRAEIEAMLVANIGMLTAAGTLTQPRATEQIALDWPLAARDGFTDPGYHAITGFVDHTPDIPNKLTDYACGGRTYSGHKGTDIFMWPFAWNKMAAGDVTIVAAADGVIVGRRDGNPDQSCNFNSNSWNAVYVRHADGSIAWYGHMKRGSLTTRGVGSMVSAGEYLGLVGSSGNSTGPHLHFELHDNQGQLIDPYNGSCNLLEGGAWWASQPNYYDSAINKLMTGTGPVSWKACPLPDDTNEAIQFQPGDRITFSTYYRDQLNTLPSLYRIRGPNGAIFAQWSQTIKPAHYALSQWWWSYDFPASVMTGTWRFEVEFNGRTYSHTFYVGEPATPTPTPIPTATATPFPDDYPRNYLPGVMRPSAP